MPVLTTATAREVSFSLLLHLDIPTKLYISQSSLLIIAWIIQDKMVDLTATSSHTFREAAL